MNAFAFLSGLLRLSLLGSLLAALLLLLRPLLRGRVSHTLLYALWLLVLLRLCLPVGITLSLPSGSVGTALAISPLSKRCEKPWRRPPRRPRYFFGSWSRLVGCSCGNPPWRFLPC